MTGVEVLTELLESSNEKERPDVCPSAFHFSMPATLILLRFYLLVDRPSPSVLFSSTVSRGCLFISVFYIHIGTNA